MTYYVGIDNSSLDHKVHILDSEGNFHSQFIIENNFAGFNQLNSVIKNLDNIMIGFELLHGPLVDYLRDKNYIIYSLNPLKIKRFKEIMTVSGNKNDKIDSSAIAEYLRKNHHQCRPLLYNSKEIERLKMLSIVHNRITEEHARYKNKLHFVIRQYFYLHESLFTNFGCTIQLKMLMKYPTYCDLKQATDEELISFLKSNKFRVSKYITKVIEKIKSYEQLISSEVEYAYSIETKMLCGILFTLDQNLNDVEKEMNAILDNHRMGSVFRSLPGAGIVLACKLLALFGDNMNRFDNANQAQCLFGTAPRNYQSGNYHKIMMRKACNKLGRAVLYSFAFSSMHICPWARSYYYEQRKRGKTNSVAIRALSNKWVKIIFRIWKDEIIYQEDKKIAVAA